MASLKEIRNRISSVSSTIQITSAMKMVSAAKLKKAQENMTSMRPYANKMEELVYRLIPCIDKNINPYIKNRPLKKILFVAISSNRGLCGSFNSNVVKEVKMQAKNYKDKEIDFVAIGKKAGDVLSKKMLLKEDFRDVYNNLNSESVNKIAFYLMEKYIDASYDKIILVYNKFKNVAVQNITSEVFLPITSKNKKVVKKEKDYIFESSREEIVNELILKYLKISLLKAIRESFVSEHGARMTAMHKATDNAFDLYERLKLTYNKARQSSITNEILEIVGGAEALK